MKEKLKSIIVIKSGLLITISVILFLLYYTFYLASIISNNICSHIILYEI